MGTDLDNALKALRAEARRLGVSQFEIRVQGDGRVQIYGIDTRGFTVFRADADVHPDPEPWDVAPSVALRRATEGMGPSPTQGDRA